MIKKGLMMALAICFCGISFSLAAHGSSDLEFQVTQKKVENGKTVLVEVYCQNMSSSSFSGKSKITVTRQNEQGKLSHSEMEREVKLKPEQEKRIGEAIISPELKKIEIRIIKYGAIIETKTF